MIDKKEFARRFAKKGDFLLVDSELAVELFSQILEEAIESREPLSINGLGKLVYSIKREHENIDMNTGERKLIPEKETVRLVLSPSLKKSLTN